MKDEHKSQFFKETGSDILYQDYDYLSTMHYGETFFSIPPDYRPTITLVQSEASESYSNYKEPAIPAFSIPIPILRLFLRLVNFDTDTDTRKSENFDSDSDTDTKVKQLLLHRF